VQLSLCQTTSCCVMLGWLMTCALLLQSCSSCYIVQHTLPYVSCDRFACPLLSPSCVCESRAQWFTRLACRSVLPVDHIGHACQVRWSPSRLTCVLRTLNPQNLGGSILDRKRDSRRQICYQFCTGILSRQSLHKNRIFVYFKSLTSRKLVVN
jgi:hypothetical protein